MQRYVKQYDGTSCGPIALINTLKWLGYSVSYDFLNIAKHLCRWKGIRGGTSDLDLEKALDYFRVEKKRVVKPSIEELDKHLDSGGAAIISYFNIYSMPGFKKNAGHFTLCIGRTDKTYLMVNDRTNRTTNRRHRKTMKAILDHEVGREKCWAWFISR
jgi:hypothetical protein